MDNLEEWENEDDLEIEESAGDVDEPEVSATQGGGLYVVAVPIGHPEDITLRAIEVLKSVDGVVCEEQRDASRLLRRLGIEKALMPLNEHTESEAAPAILEMLQDGQALALISDAGTPLFSDPGHVLVHLCVTWGIPVVPVPGPSSLMAALSVCDFDLRRFVFGGFVARDPGQRRADLRTLRAAGMAVVLMDAPYRMPTLLEDVSRIYGGTHPVMLACDLTLPEERIYRGAVDQVRRQSAARKSEFVLVIAAPGGEGKPALSQPRGSRRSGGRPR